VGIQCRLVDVFFFLCYNSLTVLIFMPKDQREYDDELRKRARVITDGYDAPYVPEEDGKPPQRRLEYDPLRRDGRDNQRTEILRAGFAEARHRVVDLVSRNPDDEEGYKRSVFKTTFELAATRVFLQAGELSPLGMVNHMKKVYGDLKPYFQNRLLDVDEVNRHYEGADFKVDTVEEYAMREARLSRARFFMRANLIIGQLDDPRQVKVVKDLVEAAIEALLWDEFARHPETIHERYDKVDDDPMYLRLYGLFSSAIDGVKQLYLSRPGDIIIAPQDHEENKKMRGAVLRHSIVQLLNLDRNPSGVETDERRAFYTYQIDILNLMLDHVFLDRRRSGQVVYDHSQRHRIPFYAHVFDKAWNKCQQLIVESGRLYKGFEDILIRECFGNSGKMKKKADEQRESAPPFMTVRDRGERAHRGEDKDKYRDRWASETVPSPLHGGRGGRAPRGRESDYLQQRSSDQPRPHPDKGRPRAGNVQRRPGSEAPPRPGMRALPKRTPRRRRPFGGEDERRE
jgi:hypothetical protein